MKVYEGKLVSEKIRIAIVASRFNEFITSKLLSGALDTLKRHGVSDDDIETAWVPGAFEIPLAASKMASSGRYDAVIALGAVISGEEWKIRCSHCVRSSYPWFNNTLRLCMQRSIQRNSTSLPVERNPCNVRCYHHRKHRTGYRAGRNESRK